MLRTRARLVDTLYIACIIASKDIVDAIKNRLVVSMIVLLGAMLLMPQLVRWAIVPPYAEVAVYDPGGSRLTPQLEDSSHIRPRVVGTTTELEQVLINSMNLELGLIIPANIDQMLQAGDQLEIDGYVTWANRAKAADLKAEWEQKLAELWGQSVRINTAGHLVYPQPSESGLALGLVHLTALTLIIVMGITLVPNLLFEEKRTRTMDALLVSPATVGQVVLGKALAGLFYVLLASGVVFAVNWSGVTHWGLAILFAISIGLFTVALGLVLGSIFESPQEVTGWTTLIILILIGAAFAAAIELQLPAAVQAVIPWVPSVALGEVFEFTFYESAPMSQVWRDIASVWSLSLLLFGAVVWQVRRSDR